MIRDVSWIGATIVGLVVTGFVFHFPGSFGELPAWDMSAFIFGAILGGISGVLVGLIQWAALLLPRRSGGRLLMTMALGIGVTHAVNDSAPQSLGLIVASILGGTGMTAGWALLGERRPLALVICLAAWTGGLLLAEQVTKALGMPFSEDPLGWATRHAVDGLVVGLVWGIATAAVGLPLALKARRDEAVTGTPLAGS